MRRSSITTAMVIAVLTAVWLASGVFSGEAAVDEHPTLKELNSRAAAEIGPPTAVRGRVIRAVRLPERVEVRGRTENKRTVDVRAETAGRVVGRPVERGDRVRTGDLLCRLALEDRQARLDQSTAAVDQARLEHEGSLRLKTGGLQSKTAIAQAKARLAMAEAERAAATLNIERTSIRAPFAGVVEDTLLEVGDYAQPGAPCVRLVKLHPMLLVGGVSETQAPRVAVGALATGRLVTGETISGPVRFVATQADPDTRTYRVEVSVPNPDYALRSGVTARFVVHVGDTVAHKVSPALFALDDAGTIGLRTVDSASRVVFNPVKIVADEADGAWVTGLPQVATLITVGHEFVVAGDRVRVALEQAAKDGGLP